MMELLLVTEAGYSLRDIRGTETRVEREEERTDLVATLRRALPFLTDPEPKRVVVTEQERGMSSREVNQRLVQLNEYRRQQRKKEEDAVNSVDIPSGGKV